VPAAGTTPPSWYGLLSLVSDDPADVRQIAGGLAVLANALDTGKLDTRQVFGVLKHFFADEIDALQTAVKQSLEETFGLAARDRAGA